MSKIKRENEDCKFSNESREQLSYGAGVGRLQIEQPFGNIGVKN